jgi:hypothetical protein
MHINIKKIVLYTNVFAITHNEVPTHSHHFSFFTTLLKNAQTVENSNYHEKGLKSANT